MWWRVAVVGLVMVACSDPDSGLEPVRSASAPPNGSVASTTTTATSSTTSTTVAVAATTTTVTATAPTVPVAVTTTTMALTDGPWRVVTSIPEVVEPGLYYELDLPGLYAYFPTKVAVDDQVFWTMNELDRPIIEAYLQAQLTIKRTMLTRPMTFDDPGWSLYFEDGGAGMRQVLQPRSDDGLALNMDLGIVMRPWVIDDQRTDTEALVVDCVNNGSLLERVDGSLSATSAPGWMTNAYAASMVNVDGQWKMRVLSSWESACGVFGPSSY